MLHIRTRGIVTLLYLQKACGKGTIRQAQARVRLGKDCSVMRLYTERMCFRLRIFSYIVERVADAVDQLSRSPSCPAQMCFQFTKYTLMIRFESSMHSESLKGH